MSRDTRYAYQVPLRWRHASQWATIFQRLTLRLRHIHIKKLDSLRPGSTEVERGRWEGKNFQLGSSASGRRRSQLYVFRAMFSAIIRSTWLYLQHLVVFTQVTAGWYLGWVETHPRHQPAATWVNTTRYCKYRQVLLVMGENIARNM